MVNFVNGTCKFDKLSHLKSCNLDVLPPFLFDILDILSFCILSYLIDVLTFPDSITFFVLLFRCYDV